MKLPFLSTYLGSLDEKGRLSIPSDYRKALSPACQNYLVFLRGTKQFYFVFEMDFYNDFIGQVHTHRSELGRLDTLDRNTVLYGESFYRQLDQQGRVTLPVEEFRTAGIGKEIMFMGCKDYFLIWDKGGYHTHRATIHLKPGEALSGDIPLLNPLHQPTA